MSEIEFAAWTKLYVRGRGSGQNFNLQQPPLGWNDPFPDEYSRAEWKLPGHYGNPEKIIISLIWCTYQDMSCRIARAGQLSESFEVKTGVRQECLLSPFLVLLVIDWIMKTTTTGRDNGIQWTLWTQLDDLGFTNDLVLLSHSHSQIQDKTTLLETTSAGTGLEINRKKTRADEDEHNCQHTSHSWWRAHQGGEVFRLPGKRGWPTRRHRPRCHSQNWQGKSSFRHAQKYLGIWRNQHENQTPHLKLQCEVSPALRMWDMADNTDSATKDQDILQHLSEVHLQKPMAGEDPKCRSMGASRTGTSGQTYTVEEVGLDWTHPQ